jgi:hypothetical protein
MRILLKISEFGGILEKPLKSWIIQIGSHHSISDINIKKTSILLLER